MSSQVEVINSERQDIVPNTDGSENNYKTPILLGLVFSLVLGFIVAGVILELSYSFRVKNGQSLPTNFNGTNRKGIYLKLENKAIGMGQTPYQIAFDQTVFSCLNICSSNSSCALFSLTKLGMCQFFDLFSTNNYRNASGVSIYVKL